MTARVLRPFREADYQAMLRAEPAVALEVPLSGCRYCGRDLHRHCQQYAEPVGWHGYAEPTRELYAQRLRARYHRRLTGH